MHLVRYLGCENFVKERRGRRYFSDLGDVDHLACRLLSQYRHRGGLWFFRDSGGKRGQCRSALDRDPHKYIMVYAPFLRVYFSSVVGNGQ